MITLPYFVSPISLIIDYICRSYILNVLGMIVHKRRADETCFSRSKNHSVVLAVVVVVIIVVVVISSDDNGNI